MAEHIKIMGAVANLLVGTWVAVSIHGMNKSDPQPFWKPLLAHIILFNTFLLLFLFSKYSVINLSRNLWVDLFPWIKDLSLLILYMLSLVLVAVFCRLTRALLYLPSGRRFYQGLFIAGLTTALGHLLFIFPNPFSWHAPWINRFLYFVEENSIVVILYFFLMLLFSKKGKDSAFYKVRRVLAMLYLLGILLFISLVPLPVDYRPIGIVMVLLFFNLIPWIWTKFVYGPHAKKRLNLLASIDMDAICQQYAISRREKEILQLMLQGKSNRDIEENLYISYHTVKNHVYSIYKKLGINSRFELLARFSGH